MKIGVMLPFGGSDGPDGTMPSWADVRTVAQAVEQTGLDSVWLADHFLHRSPDGELTGMHEALSLLSAVAAVTERVELGNLVLCSSFRDPGLTAKMAVTIDEVSSGRLILGVGAGWHDPEYEAFGLPTDHRFSRFAEWLEIVVRLLRQETVTFDGRYYSTDQGVLVPAPKRRIPLLIAGGRPKMLGLAAEWADAWNTAWFGPPNDEVAERLATLQRAVEASDRPAGAVATTVGITVRDPEHDDGEPNPKVIGGSVEELAEALRGYRDLGVAHLIVGLRPGTPRSVERLAEAKRLLDS